NVCSPTNTAAGNPTTAMSAKYIDGTPISINKRVTETHPAAESRVRRASSGIDRSSDHATVVRLRRRPSSLEHRPGIPRRLHLLEHVAPHEIHPVKQTDRVDQHEQTQSAKEQSVSVYALINLDRQEQKEVRHADY